MIEDYTPLAGDRNFADEVLGSFQERFQGLAEEHAQAEAERCMSCGKCFDCGTCWSFCQDNAIVKPLNKHEPYKIKHEFCTGCKKCAEICPCGFIEMA